MTALQANLLSGPPAPLICGRCRGSFPGDMDLALGLEGGWWACGPCRARLFGPGAAPADWRSG